MAQHDYNIANQSGADFRADLNNALSAIATVNSGATEPSTTFAHQLWVDTSSNVLKIRNGVNNAWITTGVSITASNTFTGDLTGDVTGNLTGNVTGNVTGDLTGNADTATTLATARTISLSGDVAGSASFDGSGDITITTTAQIDSIALGTDTTGDYVESMSGGTGVTVTGGTGEGSTPSIAIGQAVATTDDVTFNIITASEEFIGDLEGGIRFNAKADGALSKGDVVYISGVSGDVPTVGQAKADDASKMPAFGLALSDANDNAALQVVTFGTIEELDTSGVSEGQILYVSTTAGAYTTTAPTGESSQIQNIGKVIRSHASAGSIKVGGAGRSNATPNLDDGKIFIGNASNQSSTATLDTSIVVENTNLYYTQARFDSAFGNKDTDDLGEGTTNLYYTTSRFDSAFSGKTTADLTENTNLYYTDTRANSAIDARVTKSFVDALGIQASSVDTNSVALGTDTTGNYVATITGTANKVTVSGSGSESADITLSLPDDVQIADSLTVAGNLTVNGTLTSLDTTNLDIEDNLFQLNAGLTGSPVNDSGMLINRGNQDNGIFMWDESADKFTLGLTTADGTSTGNITLNSLGTLVANIEGDVTGTVSSISNHDTDNLTEGSTNLYYTDARSRSAISASGDISYNSSTGVISFTAGSSPVTSVNTQTGAVVLDSDDISEGSTNLYFTNTRFNSSFDTRLATKDTDDVSEGTTNQYFTTARARSSISATGDISYNSTTGVISFTAGSSPVTSVNTQTGAVVLDSDDISEGSTNLYFTNARADARVNLQTGANLDLSSKSTSDLSEGTNLYYTDARFDTRLATKDTDDVSEGATNLYYTSARFDSAFSGKSTSDLSEGTNLYYTDNRADARVNAQTGDNLDLSFKSTSDLSEGTNLYHTTERVQDVVAGQFVTNGSHTGISFVYDDAGDGAIDATVSLSSFSTSDLSEGTNLYYTDARFDTRLGTKSTSDLSEGTNLYYTDARARAAISEDSTQLSYNSTTGVLSYTQGDTDTVSEGSTNLYYTDARANSAIDTRVTKTFVDALNVVAASATGNAGTATALQTARDFSISGDITASAVSFDGTGNVALSASIDANTVGITEINVTDGTNGQVLTTDGAGNLSFTTASGGTSTTINNNANNRVITGSDTADTLEAEANFVFDGTNAGIGLSNPSQLLHLKSTGDAVLRLEADSDNISEYDNAYIEFSQDGDAVTAYVGFDYGENEFTINQKYTDDITFKTNNQERLRIQDGGISFNGDTASANQLDDYEEGTWTPELRISNSSNGIVHNIQAGKYVKIGRLVYIHCHCSLTDKSDRGGSVNIYGIPFNTNFATASAGIPLTPRGKINVSGDEVFAYPASTVFNLYKNGTDGGTNDNLQAHNIYDDTDIDFNFVYYTDS